MVSQTLVRRNNPFVIRSQGAEMLGLSGHKIADLAAESPVTIYCEQGPYTVVYCQGRNGYVLTERLATLSEVEEKPPLLSPAPGEAAATLRISRKTRWLRVVLSTAVFGSGLSLALTLL